MKQSFLLCAALIAAMAGTAQKPAVTDNDLAFHKTDALYAPHRGWTHFVEQPLPAAVMPVGNASAIAAMFAVINGSGTLNFIPKFTPTGIDIGNSQIFDNGTGVGINTAAPTYRLHVVHGGNNGIRVQSTAGFSTVDIDGIAGDAVMRLQRNGTIMWGIRNNPIANDLDFFEYGVATRIRIQKGTGFVGINTTAPSATLTINGGFTTTGIKAFTIDHPLDPENKMLRHFAVESNEVLNSYSGNVVTNGKGTAIVELPDYFEAINKDFRYQLTVMGSFAQAIISKEIKGNVFEIATNQPNIKVSWEVKGVRNDGYMRNVNEMKTEEMKPEGMKGKYMNPKAFNLPESRGVDYEAPGSKDENSTGGAAPVVQQGMMNARKADDNRTVKGKGGGQQKKGARG